MEFLSTQQAATKLGVNDSRVRQLVRAGLIPVEQVGRAFLIRKTDLEAFAKIKRPTGRPRKAQVEQVRAVTAQVETKPKKKTVRKGAAEKRTGKTA